MSARLLFLDPDPRTFGDLPQRLAQHGHRIRIASDPAAASLCLTEEAFDLILAESRLFPGAWLDQQSGASAGSAPPGRITLDTFGRSPAQTGGATVHACLLYTSPSPRD